MRRTMRNKKYNKRRSQKRKNMKKLKRQTYKGGNTDNIITMPGSTPYPGTEDSNTKVTQGPKGKTVASQFGEHAKKAAGVIRDYVINFINKQRNKQNKSNLPTQVQSSKNEIKPQLKPQTHNPLQLQQSKQLSSPQLDTYSYPEKQLNQSYPSMDLDKNSETYLDKPIISDTYKPPMKMSPKQQLVSTLKTNPQFMSGGKRRKHKRKTKKQNKKRRRTRKHKTVRK
jgi:hypothetical protein